MINSASPGLQKNLFKVTAENLHTQAELTVHVQRNVLCEMEKIIKIKFYVHVLGYFGDFISKIMSLTFILWQR